MKSNPFNVAFQTWALGPTCPSRHCPHFFPSRALPCRPASPLCNPGTFPVPRLSSSTHSGPPSPCAVFPDNPSPSFTQNWGPTWVEDCFSSALWSPGVKPKTDGYYVPSQPFDTWHVVLACHVPVRDRGSRATSFGRTTTTFQVSPYVTSRDPPNNPVKQVSSAPCYHRIHRGLDGVSTWHSLHGPRVSPDLSDSLTPEHFRHSSEC